jgi:hypothetical protein
MEMEHCKAFDIPCRLPCGSVLNELKYVFHMDAYKYTCNAVQGTCRYLVPLFNSLASPQVRYRLLCILALRASAECCPGFACEIDQGVSRGQAAVMLSYLLGLGSR